VIGRQSELDEDVFQLTDGFASTEDVRLSRQKGGEDAPKGPDVD